MMPSLSANRAPLRRLAITAAVGAMSLVGMACESDEDRMRTRIAADYDLIYDGRPKTPFYARQVLSLRTNSTWKQTTHLEIRGETTDSPPDSGTFRVQGVTLVLRSLVAPGAPVKYTISGDTLYNANATQVQALTGYDIGERTFVRVR